MLLTDSSVLRQATRSRGLPHSPALSIGPQSASSPLKLTGRAGGRPARVLSVVPRAEAGVAQPKLEPSLSKSPSKRLKRQVTLRKIDRLTYDDIGQKVHAVILAGGQQDNPLARFRAMPAVEVGANAQLIDVPISNCIRSGINKIYVLTQFNSHTLNTHISQAYPPAVFGGPKKTGFVDVLAAHQTPDSSAWYAGSADAVRRNLPTILEQYRGAGVPDELLILSGEALYQMDYSDLIRRHREMDADITLCSCSVPREQASNRGLVRVDPSTGELLDFAEKPTGQDLEKMSHASNAATPELPFEASMGIYVFNKSVLEELLNDPRADLAQPENHFGHHILPRALREDYRIMSYHFDKYWRPLSSLRDYFEVNLELSNPGSPVGIYQADETIVSRGHIAPPSTIHQCELKSTLVGEGSFLHGSKFNSCVLGINSFVDTGCSLSNCLLMGNDNYNNRSAIEKQLQRNEIPIGIGANTTMQNVIVDRNASVGNGCSLINKEGVTEADRSQDGYVITDSIITVLKSAVLRPGTKI